MQRVMDRLPIMSVEGTAIAEQTSASSTGPPETAPITPSIAPAEPPPLNAPPMTNTPASASTANDKPMTSSLASATDEPQGLQPKEH